METRIFHQWNTNRGEKMKITYKVMLTAACSAGILYSALAADVSKNKPSRRDVEQTLEEIGGDAASRFAGRLHGPAGLKLGGRGAAAIALSIVAEIQSVLEWQSP